MPGNIDPDDVFSFVPGCPRVEALAVAGANQGQRRLDVDLKIFGKIIPISSQQIGMGIQRRHHDDHPLVRQELRHPLNSLDLDDAAVFPIV